MRQVIILFVFTILISGCAEVSDKPINEPKNTVNECSSDLDCSTGGCSGQLCGQKDKIKGLITTCEWKEIYGCYKLTGCGCVDGNCQWKINDAFSDCLREST